MWGWLPNTAIGSNLRRFALVRADRCPYSLNGDRCCDRVRATDADAANHITTLSERQMQVLALVADGRTDNEIAIQLGLSAKTISSYVEHIRSPAEA